MKKERKVGEIFVKFVSILIKSPLALLRAQSPGSPSRLLAKFEIVKILSVAVSRSGEPTTTSRW